MNLQLVKRLSSIVCVFAVALTSSVATAAKKSKSSKAVDGAQSVELFQAMEDGIIDVKFIAKDAKQANVFIKNKTKKPLAVRMPAAFAGVPVLAQFNNNNFGGGGGRGNRGGGGGFGGGQQGMGGGFGGGGMGGGMMGGGGGMFNVAPEKVGKIKVGLVCLEHGKKDPNPHVKYKIVPIESFTKNQKVIELCKMIGSGQIPQNTAQAVAWHLANGMSWQKLAQKNRVKLRSGYTEKFFNGREIALGIQVAAEAQRRAEEAAKTSKANSLSQK